MVTIRHNDSLDRVFAALADPTRRAILDRLARGVAVTVGELAEPFTISRPAISKHLDVLERAGLVHRVPDGRINRCRFDGEPLRHAIGLMERYRAHWDAQLDALARYIETEDGDDDAAGEDAAGEDPADDDAAGEDAADDHAADDHAAGR